MKKLMTMIAAAAAAFGLYAEEPAPAANSYAISFETADDCTQGEALDLPQWSVLQGSIATVIARNGIYNYQGSDSRRTDKFVGANDNSLKLETGADAVVCTPFTGDMKDIFFDQTVKFTGFEEPPAVEDGKIAVWMSAIEAEGVEGEDGYKAGETNMYITCGTVDAMGAIDNKTIDLGPADLDAWHRVTIKSLGNVSKKTGIEIAGFIVYIDGQQVVSTDAAGIVDDAVIADSFSNYNASGMLFPALEEGAVATVAYKGIGELDDVVVDNLGPEFARFVEGTVVAVPNATLLLTDDQGKEIKPGADGKFRAAPNAKLTFAYTAAEGYFFKGGVLTQTFERDAADGAEFNFTTELDAKVAVAQYADATTGEPLYAASLQEALNLCPAEDEVTLLTNETLTAKLVIPAKFGAGAIILGENTITLAADQAVGIDILADGVTIDGGTIASALTANVAYSKAINIPNKNVDLKSVEIDAAHYEYAIYANCDDDCVAAGDKLEWFYNGDATFAELNCDGVSITGNGSLFHVEGMVANLKDCSATKVGDTLFGAAHQAAVYSSLNSLTTISGSGTYTHVNALQSGNLGGKIVVDEDSEAVFTGNIKSFMKVGAHPELEDLEAYPGYAAQFEFNAGTYAGTIVFTDDAELALDSFAKADDVEITIPTGYMWDDNGVLVKSAVVAMIDETPFYTLADAFAAVDDNQTITLLTAVDESVLYEGAKKFTIDLNGQTWTWNGGQTGNWAALKVFGGAADITIVDGAEGGKMYAAGDGFCVWAKTGTVTINSGKFYNNSNDDYAIYVNGTAAVVINDGEFRNEKDAPYIWRGDLAKLNLNVENNNPNATITVYGGTFSAEPKDDSGVNFVAEGYKAVVDGGIWTVRALETYAITIGTIANATLTIDGEEAANFEATEDQEYTLEVEAATGYENATITFNGATIAAGEYKFTEAGTLAASAEAITYNITYTFTGVDEADKSKIVNPNAETTTYTVEDAITFKAAECEGYEFKGFAPASITKGTIGDQEIVGTFEKKSAGPVVNPEDDEKGEIKVEGTTAEVTLKGDATDIRIEGGESLTEVTVPVQLKQIRGVKADAIKVVAEGEDITAAFTKTGDGSTGYVQLELNPAASVTLKDGTEVAVTPTIGENVEASEVDITAGEIAVQAIPGLTYELIRSTKLGDETTALQADSAKAETAKVELTDKIKGEKPAAAFYQIKVEAK